MRLRPSKVEEVDASRPSSRGRVAAAPGVVSLVAFARGRRLGGAPRLLDAFSFVVFPFVLVSSSIVVDVFRERFAASVERVVVFFRLFWKKEKKKKKTTTDTTTAASLSSAFTARSTDDDAQRDLCVKDTRNKP